MFILKKPLDWMLLTQPFGVNYASFYAGMGLNGHNGLDFRCFENDIYAAHDGKIVFAGKYDDGCIAIEIISDRQDNGEYFRTCYYHLKKILDIKVGDRVLGGQPIGISDNTGKYTTGNHLHFGLKKCDQNGNTLNYNNGFHGSIDPTPYLEPDFYKLPVDLRYGKARDWWAEFNFRFKTPWVHKYLMKILRHPLSLTAYEVNSAVYGGWDFSSVVNPAMRPWLSFITQSQYKDGQRPPKGFPLIM